MHPAWTGAFGLQLPALRMQLVGFDLDDFGLQQQLASVKQGLGPMRHQRIHGGRGHPVGFFGRWRRGDDAAVIVKNAHGIGAPGAHQRGRQRQDFFKACIAHSEVLRAVVKTAEVAVARRHAAAHPRAFLKYRDQVAGLYQRARAGDAGNAGADDGKVTLCRWVF
jgi:hypothetical protein